MDSIKTYIARQFLNKRYHFKCECLIPLDFVGEVKDYNIEQDEVLLYVELNNRLITIGLNHPKLMIEEV